MLHGDKRSSNFDADFKTNIISTAKLSVQEQIESRDFRYDNFHSFCFSDKLQKYSKARQSLRYSIAFYQKFVAGDITAYATCPLNRSTLNNYGFLHNIAITHYGR